MQPNSNLEIPQQIGPILQALCDVAKEVARLIARGGLGQDLGSAMGTNSDGDGQKALDVIADDAFRTALAGTDVRWYASEEQDHVVALNPQGRFGLAIDPLDGSSNIDVNVSIGTIFSIVPALEDQAETFLSQTGQQIAAGYFIYGPTTALMVTWGAGLHQFVLNPDSGEFELAKAHITMPQVSSEFAINASNYRHWRSPVRAYIDDCLAGEDGPRARNFNMRWVASLVAETHRIITRGGIFLYPADGRKGYENGRLRMIYECAPIAMLVEQAGGRATDGSTPILAKTAGHLHARTPLVFGCTDKVDRVATYHDLPENETSALFGSRGLFRA